MRQSHTGLAFSGARKLLIGMPCMIIALCVVFFLRGLLWA
jgi:hypothetical protein